GLRVSLANGSCQPERCTETLRRGRRRALYPLASVDNDRRSLRRPVVDVDHVSLGEIDAAVGAAVEGKWIPVREVRSGAEPVAPVRVVEEVAVIRIEDGVVDRRRGVPERRAWRLRRLELDVVVLLHRIMQAWR